MSRLMRANTSDPAFKELAKFLGIPDSTTEYRLEFVANGPVTVHLTFDIEAPSVEEP